MNFLKAIFLLISVCTCFVFNLQAQTSKIDSLRALIKPVAKDTNDVKRMIILSYSLFHEGNFEEAMQLAIKARQLSQKINYKRGEGNSLLASGYSYRLQGAPEAALKDFNEAKIILETLKDSTNLARCHNFMAQALLDLGEKDKGLQHLLISLEMATQLNELNGMAVIYIDIGRCYFERGSYEVAVEYYLRSLEISEKINAKSKIAMALNNIGVTYGILREYNKAISYFEKCLDITEDSNIKSKKAFAMTNLGGTYVEVGRYKEAREILMSSLSLLETMGDKPTLAFTYCNLGNLYLKTNDLETSKNYFNKSLELSRQINNPETSINALKGIAQLYMKAGNLNLCRTHLNEAFSIANKNHSKLKLEDLYLLQAKTDSAENNYKEAFESFKKYSTLHDSLFTKRKQERISFLEAQYDSQTTIGHKTRPANAGMDDNTVFNTKNILIIGICLLSIAIVTILVWSNHKIKNVSAARQEFKLSNSITEE